MPRRLNIQRAPVGSGSRWGALAVGLWIALLALGLRGALGARPQRPFVLILGVTIIAQFVLHLVFGRETFLYALHFAPLLVIVAAFGTLTSQRRLVRILAAALVVCAGINNLRQFDRAVAFASDQVMP